MGFTTKLFLFNFFVLCLCQKAYGSDSQTESDRQCQVLYTYGYGYRHFFHLPDTSFLHNGTILFNFSVMASSDAHILLSPLPSPGDSDAVYEIVIGAGRNSFSDIRRLRRLATRASAKTSNILSIDQMDNFWIKLENGLITVGKEGKPLPFLMWKDANPLDIKFMSFCTWHGIIGKWHYDCKGADPVPENLTDYQSLMKQLLESYDPYAIPVTDDDTIFIEVSIDLHYINLDAKAGIMNLIGRFEFAWFDPKCQWDPVYFGNISSLNLKFRKIWQPELLLHNAVGDGADPMGKSFTIIKNNGSVIWNTMGNLKTRCNLDFSDWPWDEHTCQVQLGLYGNQNSVKMHVNQKRLKNIEEHQVGKEWIITSFIAESSFLWIPFQDNVTDEAALKITINLKRRTESYYNIFLFPYFVIMIMCLSSFWISPLHVERLFLNLLAELLIVLFLINIDTNLPALTKEIPYLLVIYSRILIVTAISTVISLWLVCVLKNEVIQNPPTFICNLLKTRTVQMIFFLPWWQHYNDLVDTEPDRLIESEQMNAKEYWKRLAQIMDRIMFIILLTSIMIITFT